MYTYVNNDGDNIYVTQEHIDVAIEIYEELSRDSRSKRVSWARHKRMMETSGFDDSGNNESYRQLIKRERGKRGKLPNRSEYVEYLGNNTLEAIKQEIGLVNHSKLEANDQYTKLRKLQREMSRDIVMAETIKDAIENSNWNDLSLNSGKYVKLSGNKALATLNDIHYGTESFNNYTSEVLESLLDNYAEQLIDLCMDNDIEILMVHNGGDIIENYLHAQSRIEARQSSAKQTTGVTKVIVKFINKLSEYVKVEYSYTEGNHDRIETRYKESIDGESWMEVHAEIMRVVFESSDTVTIVEPTSYNYHIVDVDGTKVFLCHGNEHKLSKYDTLASLSMNHNINLDLVIGGHEHSYRILEVGEDKLQVTTGSIIGPNTFSNKINKRSGRSQVFVLFYDNSYELRQVKING